MAARDLIVGVVAAAGLADGLIFHRVASPLIALGLIAVFVILLEIEKRSGGG